jgi:hypothetical protein
VARRTRSEPARSRFVQLAMGYLIQLGTSTTATSFAATLFSDRCGP